MALHRASHTMIFEHKYNFRNAEYVAMKMVAIVMKKTHFRKKLLCYCETKALSALLKSCVRSSRGRKEWREREGTLSKLLFINE